MGLNKKAIMFTFMALMIAGLLSMIYSSQQVTPLDADISIDKARVNSANRFVSSLITYSKTCLASSGYRALQGMIETVITSEKFYENETHVSNNFKTCIMEGNLTSGFACPFMSGLTFYDLMDNIVNLSMEELGYNISYTVNHVWVKQELPFALIAYMNITLYVRTQDIIWNLTEIVSKDISIEGLRDPLYELRIGYESKFKETKTIREHFNASTFFTFVNDSEYMISLTGLDKNESEEWLYDDIMYRPRSFIGRLVNDSNYATRFGGTVLTLISVVNPDKENSSFFNYTNNASYVDFLIRKEYDQTECEFILKQVNGSGTAAIIDSYHLELDFGIDDTSWIDLTC